MATGIMLRLRIRVQIISCQYCNRSFPKNPIRKAARKNERNRCILSGCVTFGAFNSFNKVLTRR